MARRSCLVALLLLLASPVHAQETFVPASVVQTLVTDPEPHALRLHIALVAFNASQGADLATTMYVLGSGRGREANPIAALVTDKPAVAGALKMGISALSIWGIVRLHHSHPTAAFVISVAGTVLYSAVAIHNSQVGR